MYALFLTSSRVYKFLMFMCYLYFFTLQYLNAGVILTEGSLKAARIAVVHHHCRYVHYFLQNVLPINLTLTDEEKVIFYLNLLKI